VTRSGFKQPFFYKLVENSERLSDRSSLLQSSNSSFGTFDGQLGRSASHISLLPERFAALASSSTSIGMNSDSNASIALPMDHLSIIDELSRSSTEAPDNTLFLTASEVMGKVRYEFNPASVILASMQSREKANANTTSSDNGSTKNKKSTESQKKVSSLSKSSDKDKKSSTTGKKRKAIQSSKSDSGLLQSFLQKRQKLADQSIEENITTEQEPVDVISDNTETSLVDKSTPTKPVQSTTQQKKKKNNNNALSGSVTSRNRHVSTPKATSWNLSQDEQALRDFFL
jgi:hypothetical protein